MHPTKGTSIIYKGRPAKVAFCLLNFVEIVFQDGTTQRTSYHSINLPMQLTVIDTGSQGNAYLLKDSKGDMLLLDCGVKFEEIKQAINFNYNKVKGCLLTHEHGDHAKSVLNVTRSAIKTFCLEETAKACEIEKSIFYTSVEAGKMYAVPDSSFKFIPVNMFHDVPCLGYLVSHPDMGTLLFATDTSKLPYKFKGVKTYLIEANYCEDILREKSETGQGNMYVNERVKNSHLSIQQAIKCLEQSENECVEQVILIHLSDRNSDEVRFNSLVRQAIGKPTICASKNMQLQLNVF